MAVKMSSWLVTAIVLVLNVGFISSVPEQGRWDVSLRIPNLKNSYLAFQKTVYNESTVTVLISCSGAAKFKVSWLLRYSPCSNEYIGYNQQDDLNVQAWFKEPALVYLSDQGYSMVHYLRGAPQLHTCGTGVNMEYEINEQKWVTEDMHLLLPAQGNKTEVTKKEEKTKKEEGSSRKKRETEAALKLPREKREDKAEADKPAKSTPAAEKKPTPTPKQSQKDPKQHDVKPIAKTDRAGPFLFILQIEAVNLDFNGTVTVEIKSPSGGYLSATDWPLLPFYGVMCIIYVIFGLVWLVLLACNWRDLLRVQFWIGGVIVLGMLEKAVFFAEYESVNSSGKSVQGAVVFAEIVSSLKRALARMLVIIVSLGFGIVKPRLGPMLHKVLGVGGLYFILGSVEGSLRALKILGVSLQSSKTDSPDSQWLDHPPKGDQAKDALLAAIPLAVLDAAICWWIFTALVQTMRTLRLRRNVVKLSLYRHFTNTLIFTVLASVGFMIWSIKQHRFVTCLTDWRELWVDEAFWHLLFSVILLVIMVLWRPSANNQRYAFSPLLDNEEEEEAEETAMNDAFDGMKMRSKNQNGTALKNTKNKAEDDLKWVEENIPTSVADTALPSLLDSDEEIMTTRFEVSKME